MEAITVAPLHTMSVAAGSVGKVLKYCNQSKQPAQTQPVTLSGCRDACRPVYKEEMSTLQELKPNQKE